MKVVAIRPNGELHKVCPEVEVVKRPKAIFPKVPADLAKPGDLQSPSSTESPTCKDLVVHLFSGDDPKFWMAQEKNGVVIICIELTKFVWMVGTTGKEWKDRCSSCWTALQVCESDFDLLRVMMGHK